ncbi:MAG: hypothetical protein ACI4PP_05625, partial [Clostridia bacterium]
YTGGDPEDFLNAPNVPTVLAEFETWLDEEDVILWWHRESDILFRKILGKVLRKKETHPSVCVDLYLYDFLADESDGRGNYYDIAAARGIDTDPARKHCAENDVRVLRELLAKIAFPPSALLKPRPKVKKPASSPNTGADAPYQYDPRTNVIHRPDCPRIEGIVTVGYEDFVIPLRRGYKSCSCCKEEYREALPAYNDDLLERLTYTYIFTPESNVFHKYTCRIMRRAKKICGTEKYKTVVKTGRRPCKICKPGPEDYRPLSLSQKKMILEKKTDRMVPKDEAKAIKRQKIAAEERYRKLKDENLSEDERNDIYTLTQPRFAFWVGQGYQTFHLHSCPKLRGVRNLKGFGTFKEAVRAGYSPCRTCKPTAKHDVKFSIPITNRICAEESVADLKALCRDADYSYEQEGRIFYLATPVGKWRIHLGVSPVKVDHINMVKNPTTKKYHEQPRRFLSLKDAFDYIRRHDESLEQKGS